MAASPPVCSFLKKYVIRRAPHTYVISGPSSGKKKRPDAFAMRMDRALFTVSGYLLSSIIPISQNIISFWMINYEKYPKRTRNTFEIDVYGIYVLLIRV